VARVARKMCMKLNLHIQSQMPGVWYRLENHNESRNLSGLMRGPEMRAFLEGMEKALEELQFVAQDEINARQKVYGNLNEETGCAHTVVGALFCPCPSCNEVREERRRHKDIK
jgi:hypothetical protein